MYTLGISTIEGGVIMAKGKDKGKAEDKKKPQHTLKEKRAAKKEKKLSKGD